MNDKTTEKAMFNILEMINTSKKQQCFFLKQVHTTVNEALMADYGEW